jgi:nucleoside 2-deoxyribosyltransferase
MNTYKIFIACPVSKYIKDKIFLDEAFKTFMQRIYMLCKKFTPQVFLALEREKYGQNLMIDTCTALDFEDMKSSNLVIAIPDDSMGVAVELGWASALNKSVVLVLDRHQRYSPLISGLHEITRAEVIWYNETGLTEDTFYFIEQLLKKFCIRG